MKILHVASFKGNVGDIANHFGFRSWFEGFFSETVEWAQFEIRDIYRNIAAFDDRFVELANQFDLVVIGGGNFFEMWVEKSPTGTSISIEKKYLDKINAPIFFNSLGVDDGMGVSQSTVERFNLFLSNLLESNRFLVSVRNDGAISTLHRHIYAGTPIEKILSIPDGGFFAEFKKCSDSKIDNNFPVIGINLAGDMLSTRFPGQSGMHDYNSFLDEFVMLINLISDKWPKVKFILFPHIYSDVRVCADLLDRIPDVLRRNQVRIATYDTNIPAVDTVFSEYMTCDLVLSMRFHANVVPLANGIPSIALYCYKQIYSLFKELDMERYVVDVRKPDFSQSILRLIEYIIDNKKEVISDLLVMKTRVNCMRDESSKKINSWLLHNGLVHTKHS